jgi:hypothetical protein
MMSYITDELPRNGGLVFPVEVPVAVYIELVRGAKKANVSVEEYAEGALAEYVGERQ